MAKDHPLFSVEPASLVPKNLQEILPICPCGCRSRLAAFYTLEEMAKAVPDYVKERALKTDETWLEIERSIIHHGDFIESPLVHRLRHLKLMMPWMTHDPNLVRMLEQSLLLEDEGRKIHGMMGNASCGKTNYLVLRAMTSIDIWPEHSEVYVASPTKTAGEYLLWQEFLKCFRRLEDHGYPIHKNRNNVISINGNNSGPGTIAFVGFGSVGTMRGKKMISQDKGELIIELDEIGEFANDSILRIIANLKSQKGLRVLSGTNFRDPFGLDGKFFEPEDFSWNDLSREHSYEWKAINGGWASRFRAITSPNLAFGIDYYPYLLTEDGHNELLQYGKDSEDYLSQADSFVSIETVGRTLINRSEVQGAGCFVDVKLAQKFKENFGFVDPSFTYKGDKMVFTSGTLGEEDGNQYEPDDPRDKRKIRANHQLAVPVPRELTWTTEWLDLAIRLRKGKALKSNMKDGEKMSSFDFCALQSAKFCLDNSIPFTNFGYDDSMRGLLTQSMMYFMGEGVRPYYYGGKPDHRIAFPIKYKFQKGSSTADPKRVPMLNVDKHEKYVSQMWFTTAELLRNGYVRNVFAVDEAVDQLCKRLKEVKTRQSQKYEDVESKDQYKERNRNKSPDHCDSFCGLCNLIVELRLTPKSDTSDISSKTNFEHWQKVYGAIEVHSDSIVDPLDRGSFQEEEEYEFGSR